MRQMGISVAIVVRGRESRPHGEGPQLERWVRSHPVGCEGLGILADADGALRPINSSQAGAVCGESRTHGPNEGDGETGRKIPRFVPTHWEAELPELAEVAELCRPLGNRGRMGARRGRRGRFRTHR